MKRIILLVILVGAVLPAQAGEPLADLIAKVSSMASPGHGMNEAEEKLAEELAAHGTAAADLLIPLLKSESEDVRQLALHCLGELPADSVLDAHLPALMEANEEHGFSPDGIAAIESDAAVHLLAKEFRKALPFEHLVGEALLRMGPRSVVPLLKEFNEAGEEEESFLDELAGLWKKLGDGAESAVPLLLAIALNEEAPLFRRQNAIRYLGAIGPTAEKSFPKLGELVAAGPDRFGDAVREAIAASRTAEAADLLLVDAIAVARAGEGARFFGGFAELGVKAAHLGDRLAELLDDPDANVRTGACAALGYTGRLDLWPVLARALKDQDWRVAYSACISLARLQAKGALPSLRAAAESHWYPRVRFTAIYAEHQILGTEVPLEVPAHVGHGAKRGLDGVQFGSFDSTDYGLSPMDEASVAKLGVFSSLATVMPWSRAEWLSPEQKTFEELHPKLYGAIAEETKKAKNGHWGECRLKGMVERGESTLVALSAGEWVGGLFAVTKEGKASLIVDENVHELIDWNGRLIALVGMWHMGMDEGRALEITQKNGVWSAKFLYAMPGCPWSGGVLPDGRLFANCEGGAVAVGKDGRFEYLGGGTGRGQ
jgi:HEAT repeat protein